MSKAKARAFVMIEEAIAADMKKKRELDERIAKQVALIEVKHGKDGVQGLPGEQGLQGSPGLPGTDGSKGKDGKAGTDGVDGITTVIHETIEPDTSLFMTREEFEERIKEAERKTMQGGGLPAPSIKEAIHYFEVIVPYYSLHLEALKPGTTILGVNYPGDVLIHVPNPKRGCMLIIKDESGNAGTHNITVKPTGF